MEANYKMKVEKIYTRDISFVEIYKNIINQKIDSFLKEHNSKKDKLFSSQGNVVRSAKS